MPQFASQASANPPVSSLVDPHSEALADMLKDWGAGPALTRLCEEAKTAFHVPVAMISVVEGPDARIVAAAGADLINSLRDHSFCGCVVRGDDVLVVPDASQDQRFADNPLVTGAMHLRFYAGTPLILTPSLRIGAFCLIDSHPRQFSRSECERLRMMALLAVAEIRARQIRVDLEQRRRELEARNGRSAN